MSAAERLQAAIDKLENLRKRSTGSEWEIDTNYPFSAELVGIFAPSVRRYAVKFDRDELPKRTDAELVVTLHRTIDAQLAVLGHGLDRAHAQASGDPLFRVKDAVVVEIASELADAILGDAS